MSMDDLGDMVRRLGSILGETIRELEGERMLDLVEQIRTLSKDLRSGRTAAGDELLEMVASLKPREIDVVARAFAWWFVLVNLAEERERVRVIRERKRDSEREGRPMEESLAEALAVVAEQGRDPLELLRELRVEPVLTAHPTEARRRVVASRVSAIRNLLREGDAGRTAGEFDSVLREEIAGLWLTDPTRHDRPTVMDEVRSGLIAFESTLFDVVADTHHQLARLTGARASEVPVMYRVASWIGGDRDGNPNVDHSITRQTLFEQARTAVRLHRRAIERLHGHLSISDRRAGSELMDRIARDEELLGPEITSQTRRLGREPVRRKLALTWWRLGESLESLMRSEGDTIEWSRAAIRTRDELLEELLAVEQSLHGANLSRLAEGRFARVLLQARIFGFHLAPLDVRQHAERFESLLSTLFSSYGIADSWAEMPEEDRMQLLEQELAAGRPLVGPATQLEAEDMELVRTLRMIRWAHRTFGEESIGVLILSMTTRASDLMGALLLARDAGVEQIDVVPLFETIPDLRNGEGVLQSLFRSAAWREQLERRGGVQQIMIGYSDSNKDGGYLAANWHLYQAQRAMTAACEAEGVRPLFFHGRGGSIGRGGGPANRAILAQPPGTVRGGLRITEQGEVIADRYSDPEIAERQVGQILNAVMRMSIDESPAPREEWLSAMQQMADYAEREYRALVHESEELVEYFHATTPIEVLPELNIGSRPARRKGGKGIEDLRAIPWVFAWTQSRVNLPGWYGLGSALHRWSEENRGWERLREMYREWPMFAAVIDNAQMSLRKADLRVAALYSRLADPGVRDAVWPKLESEYESTERALLEVTGESELLEESWLAASIQLRNPYIDPMNAIQLSLLERLRSTESEDDRRWMLEAILVCVNGIAGGLRNTG